jgi:hypothetical protein
MDLEDGLSPAEILDLMIDSINRDSIQRGIRIASVRHLSRVAECQMFWLHAVELAQRELEAK